MRPNWPWKLWNRWTVWKNSCRFSGPQAKSAASICLPPKVRLKSSRSCFNYYVWQRIFGGKPKGRWTSLPRRYGKHGVSPPASRPRAGTRCRPSAKRRTNRRGIIASGFSIRGTRRPTQHYSIYQAGHAIEPGQHWQGIRARPVCGQTYSWRHAAFSAAWGAKQHLGPRLGYGPSRRMSRKKWSPRSKPHEIVHNKQESCERPDQVLSDFWTIGIPHPWKAGKRIAEIKLRNRAIGTSSSQFQSFRHKGKLYGHIIDPRTGRPAEGLLSATVVAGSSALADALSTAFFVMGLEKSLAYAQAHPEIAAVLLTHCGRGGDVEIHRCGLDDGDFLDIWPSEAIE